MANSDSDSGSIAAFLGKGLLKVVLHFLYTVYGGWVLTIAWGWFAVAFFHMAPITILGAIALSLLRSVFFMDIATMRVALAVDKHLKLDNTTKGLVDWIGQPLLDTMVLIACIMTHFVLFPLLIAFGLS